MIGLVVTAGWYMTLAAALFAIGAAGLLLRRNALVMFMSIELMLNAVNLTFVAAGRELNVLEGQIAVLFVAVVAAASCVQIMTSDSRTAPSIVLVLVRIGNSIIHAGISLFGCRLMVGLRLPASFGNTSTARPG